MSLFDSSLEASDISVDFDFDGEKKPGLMTAVKSVFNACGDIKLKFDKFSYYPGEVVKGHAELSLTESVSAKNITVHIEGLEITGISHEEDLPRFNHRNIHHHTMTVWNHDKQKFFNHTIVLADFGGRVLKAGQYNYDFQFQLPNAPPSYVFTQEYDLEHSSHYFCEITYTADARLDMQGRDIKQKKFLNVASTALATPQAVHCENQKSFLIGSGELKMYVDVPNNVCKPGEEIKVHVKVVNGSSRDVAHLKIKLMQHAVVKCKGERREGEQELHKTSYEGVKAHTTVERDLLFTIPDITFPSVSRPLITGTYHLNVECDITLAGDLNVHPKITIVTAPDYHAPVDVYEKRGSHSA